jgi:hypothetical protein
MILQLNPPLPVSTPKGTALAHFLIDYSMETHLYWTVFLDGSGECWTFANPEIRIAANPTVGRPVLSQIHRPVLETATVKPSVLNTSAAKSANG